MEERPIVYDNYRYLGGIVYAQCEYCGAVWTFRDGKDDEQKRKEHACYKSPNDYAVRQSDSH